MKRPLTDAEANHLRRLLGWIACEIGQPPEELVETVRKIAPAIGPDISDEGKARLVRAHENAANVPKYVRAAIKALQKTQHQTAGDVVDAEMVQEVRTLKAPNAKLTGDPLADGPA